MHGTRIKVTKLFLHETGSYNNQYRRSYNTNLTNGGMNIMLERLNNVSNYESTMMGGIANQFISPSATPEKQIVMANGWNERRMRFMMEIVHDYYTGGSITEVILGYTDHTGVNISGAIDPHMEFYINSTLHMRNTVIRTAVGNQNQISISDSSHVLVDNNWTGIYSEVKDQRMRPEDVYCTMERANVVGFGDDYVLDARAMGSTLAVKSRRANSSAANYMSQILKGYNQAAIECNFGEGVSELHDKARSNVKENIAAKDPFLSAISQVRGMPVGNTFTFNDLRMIDPNIEYVTRAQQEHRLKV